MAKLQIISGYIVHNYIAMFASEISPRPQSSSINFPDALLAASNASKSMEIGDLHCLMLEEQNSVFPL